MAWRIDHFRKGSSQPFRLPLRIHFPRGRSRIQHLSPRELRGFPFLRGNTYYELPLNPPLKGKTFLRRRPPTLPQTDRRVERMGEEPVSCPIASSGRRPDNTSRSARHTFYFHAWGLTPSWVVADGQPFIPVVVLPFRQGVTSKVSLVGGHSGPSKR